MNVLVQCNSLEEAAVAVRAVEAYRAGLSFLPQLDVEQAGDGLAKRLRDALSYPDNDGIKTCILEALLAAEPGEWVAYPTIVEVVAKQLRMSEDDSGRRTPAALRDLSWQVKQKVDPSDLSGKQKAIEVLAERVRTGGTYSYRLTAAGRRAVEVWSVA